MAAFHWGTSRVVGSRSFEWILKMILNMILNMIMDMILDMILNGQDGNTVRDQAYSEIDEDQTISVAAVNVYDTRMIPERGGVVVSVLASHADGHGSNPGGDTKTL